MLYFIGIESVINAVQMANLNLLLFGVLVEIFVSTEQNFEPKSATKKLPNGKLVSPPLEDLAPFLDRKELLDNLYIKPLDNE